MPSTATEPMTSSMGSRRRGDDIVAELGSDVRLGLPDEEVRSRLERYGRNELAVEKPVPAWRRFLAQFKDVLDASMPGGLLAGTGSVRYGQTMAFTTLMLFQIFNVPNARSDEDSAFAHLFTNAWLWTAMGVSVALQVLVVYVPFLQRAFGTTPLSGGDWLLCVGVASSVLWLREASKALARAWR